MLLTVKAFTIKESEVAEVKEDESAEDCQSAGHMCRALVLYYSASKGCYYQANGPTQGGHVAFI